MDKLIFKRVTKVDATEVFHLVEIVLNSLDRKEFFMPDSDQEKTRFFDENYAYTYGAYKGDKLIAINQIYIEEDSSEEYRKILNIDKAKSICELGGFLVIKEYRGKGIMTKLSKMQYDLAKTLGFDYIVATAHPENIASCKVLEKLGMKLYDTITTSNNYLRNLYVETLE